jgi:hypothetical protein
MKAKSASMIKVDVLPDELMSALQDAVGFSGSDDGWRTVKELSKSTGMCTTRVQELLGKLIENGKACVSRVRRQSIDGRLQLIPAYKIMKEAKKC